MKFRKKPVVIEAVQVGSCEIDPNTFLIVPDTKPFSEFPEWLVTAINKGEVAPCSGHSTNHLEWEIRTLEDGVDGRAVHVASPGDWIIQGVNGELYPCKPDIFEKTYELAENLSTPETHEKTRYSVYYCPADGAPVDCWTTYASSFDGAYSSFYESDMPGAIAYIIDEATAEIFTVD